MDPFKKGPFWIKRNFISKTGDNVLLVTESLYWRLFSVCWLFFNILNRLPASKTCHQHISSPTSVTNIDVTI